MLLDRYITKRAMDSAVPSPYIPWGRVALIRYFEKLAVDVYSDGSFIHREIIGDPSRVSVQAGGGYVTVDGDNVNRKGFKLMADNSSRAEVLAALRALGSVPDGVGGTFRADNLDIPRHPAVQKTLDKKNMVFEHLSDKAGHVHQKACHKMSRLQRRRCLKRIIPIENLKNRGMMLRLKKHL